MRFNLLLTSGLFALLAAAALAQRGGFQRMQQPDDPYERVADRREAEFHFIRLEYTDLPQFHRRFGRASREGMGEGWWVVDWPAADNHFTAGVQRLTRIDTGDPRHFRLTDEHLFDYPWIYATQAGWWDLSDLEIARLRASSFSVPFIQSSPPGTSAMTYRNRSRPCADFLRRVARAATTMARDCSPSSRSPSGSSWVRKSSKPVHRSRQSVAPVNRKRSRPVSIAIASSSSYLDVGQLADDQNAHNLRTDRVG